MTMAEQAGVREHFEMCRAHYLNHQVFGTFLYGSQNYGLSTPESDVDTKTIILPNFDNLFSTVRISTIHQMADGQCDVKDIRDMFTGFLKANINFLETLFTPFFYINPRYNDEWGKLFAARHEIANSAPRRLLHAVIGMARQKYERVFRKGLKDYNEDLRYSPKDLAVLFRLTVFLQEYFRENNFEAALLSTNRHEQRNHYFSLKAGTLPQPEAENEANFRMGIIMAVLDDMGKRTYKDNHTVHDYLELLANTLTKQVLKEELQ